MREFEKDECLEVMSNDIDNILEYFNLDNPKSVMYLCKYDRAMNLFLASGYDTDEFKNYFSIGFDSDYEYYSVYQDGKNAFIIEKMVTLDGKLYSEYGADIIMVESDIADNFGEDLFERFEDYQKIIITIDEVDIEDLDTEPCNGDCESCRYAEEDDCNYQEFNDDEEDEIDEIDELIESYLLRIAEGEECPHCLLKQFYSVAYKDGMNSLALGIGDIMHDIVEED